MTSWWLRGGDEVMSNVDVLSNDWNLSIYRVAESVVML